MIQDARVLQDEFLPKEVRHRDAEVNQLTTALEPITRESTGETTFIFGPTGAGKTCISKFAVEQLREEVVGLNTQYVNCWEDYNRYRTLYRILAGINQTFDIHRQSTPEDELLERLRDYDGPPYVIILDEVDQLNDTKVLYNLYSIPDITMILIANQEEELFADMESRVRSRLNDSIRTRFERYTLPELVEILEDRIRWGLSENCIGNEQLHRIADMAAGDARVAIGALRRAAQQAQKSGRSKITDEVLEGAIPEAKQEIRQKNLSQLTPDQKLLYGLISDTESISPGELYDQYCEQVEDPKTKRTIRNYLQKLTQYDLITARGQRRGRRYLPMTADTE